MRKNYLHWEQVKKSYQHHLVNRGRCRTASANATKCSCIMHIDYDDVYQDIALFLACHWSKWDIQQKIAFMMEQEPAEGYGPLSYMYHPPFVQRAIVLCPLAFACILPSHVKNEMPKIVAALREYRFGPRGTPDAPMYTPSFAPGSPAIVSDSGTETIASHDDDESMDESECSNNEQDVVHSWEDVVLDMSTDHVLAKVDSIIHSRDFKQSKYTKRTMRLERMMGDTVLQIGSESEKLPFHVSGKKLRDVMPPTVAAAAVKDWGCNIDMLACVLILLAQYFVNVIEMKDQTQHARDWVEAKGEYIDEADIAAMNDLAGDLVTLMPRILRSVLGPTGQVPFRLDWERVNPFDVNQDQHLDLALEGRNSNGFRSMEERIRIRRDAICRERERGSDESDEEILRRLSHLFHFNQMMQSASTGDKGTFSLANSLLDSGLYSPDDVLACGGVTKGTATVRRYISGFNELLGSSNGLGLQRPLIVLSSAVVCPR